MTFRVILELFKFAALLTAVGGLMVVAAAFVGPVQ